MCDGRNHPLKEIYRSGYEDDIQDVVRWCPECGAIVVDGEIDGRTRPGGGAPMRFPSIRHQTKATDPLLKEMAEALLIAKDIINRYANNNKRIAGYSNIEDALQKYHEQEGE